MTPLPKSTKSLNLARKYVNCTYTCNSLTARNGATKRQQLWWAAPKRLPRMNVATSFSDSDSGTNVIVKPFKTLTFPHTYNLVFVEEQIMHERKMWLNQSQHLYNLLQIISNQLLEWGGGCNREIIGRKWKWPQSWTIQWQPSKLELSQSKPAFTNRTVGCVGDKKSHSTAKLIGVCGCGSGPGLTSRLRPAERFICQKGIIFSNQVFINFQFLNYHQFIRVIGWIKRPLYLFSTDAFTRDHRYGLLLPSPSCQALWGGAYHLLFLIRTISSTLISLLFQLQVVEIPTRIHLVLQLAPGGELFTKLTEQGTFFFSGSVCKCALFAILHQESGYDRKRYDLKYSKANIQRRGRDKYSSKWLLPWATCTSMRSSTETSKLRTSSSPVVMK